MPWLESFLKWLVICMITLTHCPKYIKSRSSRMTSRYMKTLIGYSREQYLHLRSTKYIYWNSAAQPVYVTTLLFTASFSLYRKTNRFEMGSSPKQWRKDVSKKRTRKNGSQSSTKPSNTCLSRNMHVMILKLQINNGLQLLAIYLSGFLVLCIIHPAW